MTLNEYIAMYDDSDPWVTAKDAVWLMATLAAQLDSKSILELGSFKGASAVAFGVACPAALVTAVDLADTVPARVRQARYTALGLRNVIDVTASAEAYLKMFSPRGFDVVFHDAQHGEAIVPEYADAWRVARKLLVVHDWEQTKTRGEQLLEQVIAPESQSIYWHRDRKNRVTLLAQRAT